MSQSANCNYCAHYSYDEDCGYMVCEVNLDEDEMERFIKGDFSDCPFFQYGDEYKVVRKQI